MKFNKMLAKIDDAILGDIISKCEGKMVEPGEGKPFKKKAVAIEIEPEQEEFEMEDGGDEKEAIMDKLDAMDEDELLKLYEKMGG